MRKQAVFLFGAFLIVYLTGCTHEHAVMSVNVKDTGERIRTKYKYKIGYWFNSDSVFKLDNDRWMVDDELMKDLAKWQPDVFDEGGMPVTSEMTPFQRSTRHSSGNFLHPSDGRKVYGYPVLPFLSVLSCFTIPVVNSSHFHEKWPFQVNGDDGQKVSVETCANVDSAFAFLPFPWLLCWWNTDTCYSGRRTFDSHEISGFNSGSAYSEATMRAMAYGLAVRLKELEDSGKINDDLAVNAIASLETTAKLPSETPFEIVRCENTAGKDFEYDFVLKNKGGGKLKLSDYERVRSAFRTAIVNTYHMTHPMTNPRSLVTDFSRYTMKGEYITGRVSVLTIEVKTVFYDAAKRTGRMSAKIGSNQFEDVRRYIRSHIEELATRSNIVIDGDALPQGARFYTGNERLAENGLLEVEFRTE